MSSFPSSDWARILGQGPFCFIFQHLRHGFPIFNLIDFQSQFLKKGLALSDFLVFPIFTFVSKIYKWCKKNCKMVSWKCCTRLLKITSETLEKKSPLCQKYFENGVGKTVKWYWGNVVQGYWKSNQKHWKKSLGILSSLILLTNGKIVKWYWKDCKME